MTAVITDSSSIDSSRTARVPAKDREDDGPSSCG
jgi:hypothetical protein